MSLLEITHLTHAFGDGALFRDASLTLNQAEHIGVVGHNGAGKSTLIKICTGQLIPDAGRVAWLPGVGVGYLDQYARIDCGMTLGAYLESAFQDLYALESALHKQYDRAAAGDENALDEAARIAQELERRDFYSIGTRVEQVAAGLGLLPLGLDRHIGQMSGGQRAKAILARLLLARPDVLLLDEPTNFLDKEHVAWLADDLARFPNAFLVVSHDGAFLDRVASHICDIADGRIAKYAGSYSAFLKKRELLREDYARQYAAQQKEIRRTEEFIRKNIAGIKSRMAKGRQKRLDRLDKLESPGHRETRPVFRFPAPPAAGKLDVARLSVGYQSPVLSNLSFTVGSGQKVVVTGFNGAGKTTLLRTLVRQIPALGGAFSFSAQTAVGYFEQDRVWEDAAATPFQLVAGADPTLVSREIRRCLAQCGISAAHALQPVGSLSGGEQAKVRLCLLALRPWGFLILDEPTNHLDPLARSSLREALAAFPGTVLLVSHEEEFYRGWTHRTIDVGQSSGQRAAKPQARR